MSLRATCGALLIGGFSGTSLPASFARRLRSRELGGAILFTRNLTSEMEQVAALTREIANAQPDVAASISIDQEGGRVARLKAPVVRLPPAASLAARCDETAIAMLAEALGQQLAALGFSIDWAPVLDVHTNPNNPVIGDRAFGTEPESAARAALAFARGLMRAGVAACGKHYPGHGDTLTDSHLELPRVEASRDRLEATELVPFRTAATQLPALMSAHVVYPAWDDQPATLSRKIATDMLRGDLRFEGVLVSDDLEMRAIADRHAAADAAVLAIDAGCDALLICSNEDAQVAALEGLVRRAEANVAFRARCEEAYVRVMKLRTTFRPRPVEGDALARALRLSPDVTKLAAELAT